MRWEGEPLNRSEWVRVIVGAVVAAAVIYVLMFVILLLPAE